jgi:hypothetical protein
MYLFSRRARLSGAKFRDSMAWATSITERVTQTSGLQVGLWSQTFSPAVGTLVWSTFVPDLASLEAANDKLMVDDAYNELIERGNEYLIQGSMDDTLGMIVHGEPDPNRHVEYVAVVRSTISAGKLARGITLGVEIAQRAEQITGLPTAFLADSTGNYGGVAWLSAFANVAELERAEQTLNADQSFIELIDTQAPGVYADQPGANTQLVYRRVI